MLISFYSFNDISDRKRNYARKSREQFFSAFSFKTYLMSGSSSDEWMNECVIKRFLSTYEDKNTQNFLLYFFLKLLFDVGRSNIPDCRAMQLHPWYCCVSISISSWTCTRNDVTVINIILTATVSLDRTKYISQADASTPEDADKYVSHDEL